MSFEVCIEKAKKLILPVLKKIIKSLISKCAKRIYERLYGRFCNAVESYEQALLKCLKTTDVEKLKKHIDCCGLGLSFFKQMQNVLEDTLPDYEELIAEGKERLKRLENGGEV